MKSVNISCIFNNLLIYAWTVDKFVEENDILYSISTSIFLKFSVVNNFSYLTLLICLYVCLFFVCFFFKCSAS